MSVITLSITESEDQYIDGIPKDITIDASIPSTIFYTTDGSIPTTASSIYNSILTLPNNIGAFVLKLFATNGVDNSVIISTTYGPNSEPIRNKYDTVLNNNEHQNFNNSFPYSNISTTLPIEYGPIGLIPVHNPDNVGIDDGFDGAGGIANKIDLPIEDYPIRYSTTDSIGQTGAGIGNLPANVTIQLATDDPEFANVNDRLFNPKAKVIYQDNTDPTSNPSWMINRPQFSMENLERTKDGALLNTTDPLPYTGSFVRTYYNPTDQTLTYYYFDSQALRWIISKEPYAPITDRSKSLANIIFSSRHPGSSKVFEWVPFNRRVLT